MRETLRVPAWDTGALVGSDSQCWQGAAGGHRGWREQEGAQLGGATPGQAQAGNRNAMGTHLGCLVFPWPVVTGVKPHPLKYYLTLKNTGTRWDEGQNPELDLNPI